jgi:hypothetical protein
MRDAGGGPPDPDLVAMFRGMRQDARSDPQPAEIAESFPIDIGFDGAGLLPTVGSVMILPLGNLKARITGAVMVANGIGTATIALQLGTFADVPHLSTIYGSGSHPTLTTGATAILDTTSWRLNLQPADVLIATLIAVTSAIAPPLTGALTCVCLSLQCRRMKWPAGGLGLADSGGNVVVDANGNHVQLRS